MSIYEWLNYIKNSSKYPNLTDEWNKSDCKEYFVDGNDDEIETTQRLIQVYQTKSLFTVAVAKYMFKNNQEKKKEFVNAFKELLDESGI